MLGCVAYGYHKGSSYDRACHIMAKYSDKGIFITKLEPTPKNNNCIAKFSIGSRKLNNRISSDFNREDVREIIDYLKEILEENK